MNTVRPPAQQLGVPSAAVGAATLTRKGYGLGIQQILNTKGKEKPVFPKFPTGRYIDQVIMTDESFFQCAVRAFGKADLATDKTMGDQ